MAEESLRFTPRSRLEPDFLGETQVGLNRFELSETPELRRRERLEVDAPPIPYHIAYANRKMPYRRRRYGPKRRRRSYRRGINPHYAMVPIHRDPELRKRDILALQGLGTTGKALYKDASEEEQAKRKYLKWRGAGMYMGGRGAYNSGTNRLKKAMKWRAFAGDTLGMLRGITGMGEYETNAIVDQGVASMGDAPTFESSGDDLGGMCITHTEYLTDVYGNGSPSTDNFELYEWSINPGLERSVPWLAQVAMNFEEYELIQLLYTFRSTISNDASTSNGQVGSIIMCTNYNASAGPFLDKGQMMQYAGANSGKVTNDLVHGVECDPRQTSLGGSGLYVRSSPVVPGEDLKTYDLGIFSLAVSGTPTNFANQPIGELWVTYKCKLRKPKLYTGIGSGISTDIYASDGLPTGSQWMGTLLKGQQNNIGTSLVQTGTGVYQILFPANSNSFYEIQVIFVNATMPVGTIVTSQVGGSIVAVSDFPLNGGATSSAVRAGQGAALASGGYIILYHVKSQVSYNGVPNTFQLTLTGNVPTFDQNIIRITEYNTMANTFKPPVFVNAAGTIVTP